MRRSVTSTARYSSHERTRSAGRLIASSTGSTRCTRENTRFNAFSWKPWRWASSRTNAWTSGRAA
jgi:hypothetical protein